MRISVLIYLAIVCLLVSCSSGKEVSITRQYRKSSMLSTYMAMADEFQDHCLVLKENGSFRYCKKLLGLNLGVDYGTFNRNGDTLWLNWQGTDPKDIADYLSSKCILHSTSISFVDEISDRELVTFGKK
jgi:hypothetical protein